MKQATAEHLATLFLAAGFLSSTPATHAQSPHRWQASLLSVDRTPYTRVAGKSMTCGKCATQGMCGESYLDKQRKAKQHSTPAKSVAPKRDRSQHSR